METYLEGWELYRTAGDSTTYGLYNPAGYTPEGVRVVAIYQDNANGSPSSDYTQILSPRLSVEPGTRYCVSAYMGADNCTGRIYANFYNSSGTIVGYTDVGATYEPQVTEAQARGGPQLKDFKRCFSFGTAPSTASFARFVVRKYVTNDGSSNSKLYFTRFMMAEATALQTAPGPWVTYSTDNSNWVASLDMTRIDGGKIYTGSVTADAIAANAITSGKIAAGQITSTHVSTNQIVAYEANLGNAVVTTLKIGANAVTVPSSVAIDSGINLSNMNWIEILGLLITRSGAPVLVQCYWLLHVTWPGTATAEFISFEISRNNYNLRTVDVYLSKPAGPITIPFSYAYLDTTSYSGSYEYEVNMYKGDSDCTINVRKRVMILTEMKR